MTPLEDFDTGLFLEGDQWLAWWKPEMTYDEWEDARTEATARIVPSLAQRLTQRAKGAA
jgi:hypothetical protein